MQELIRIITDTQGVSVVSARELHEFLCVKARFNDWIKRRIIKYGLIEGVDYIGTVESVERSESDEGVLLNSEYNPGGRPETDYGLPLDVAKELCMVENNEKGREARRYFIEAEKALRQIVEQPPVALSAPAVDQTLLTLLAQQTQLLTDQQQTLHQLRADIDQIMAGKKPARSGEARLGVGQQLGLPGLPAVAAPHQRNPLSQRQAINRKVNAYCERWRATQSETYGYLYRRLFEVYRINVNQLKRSGKESLLDALERYGYLDRLDSLIMAELDYRDDA